MSQLTLDTSDELTYMANFDFSLTLQRYVTHKRYRVLDLTCGHFRGHSHDFREQNKILNVK